MTWFTEGSTPFINFNSLMKFHDQKGFLRTLNGFYMVFSFFVFRMMFYNYIIFWKMQDFCLYRYYTFWHQYPKELHNLCYFSIALYIFMFGLNLYWFSKILFGYLKVLGLDIAIEQTDRKLDAKKVKEE